MFCYQCEQVAKGTGCTKFGVCGKAPDVSALEDLLVRAAQGISTYAHRAYALGAGDREVDVFVIKALFTTVTNVNFDPERLGSMLRTSVKVRAKARAMYEKACGDRGMSPEVIAGPAALELGDDIDTLIAQGEEIAAARDGEIKAFGADIVGLKDLILFGLKGMAAYADHAQILGVSDPELYRFFHEAMDFLTRTDTGLDDLVAMAMRCGEVNLRVMELLDRANTGAYGHPRPTPVRVGPVAGKAILVSGHDLKDLEELLKQTSGTGINVYTHGEMIPAHGYPELKKYGHLVGNYGSAWQNQASEFEAFPGAILMTTNCLQKPRESYRHRIFTSGLVAWPGVTHVTDHDFSPVIKAALAEPGFAEDGTDKTIMVGFGHNAVMGVADKVIDAVKSGAIRHFFLIGGCDGAKPGRNYYTELAEKIPSDCVILTLACGKYRFNGLDFGDIDGIPRLLDVGQCNDAYSAVKIAQVLASAFETDVNSLPLSLILSWYEQKAVCILLSLLYLGIRDIRIGPSMPAFITPAVYGVLKENFHLMPITTAEEDLEAVLG